MTLIPKPLRLRVGGLALAVAVLAGSWAEAAPRVFSLDQCADQFVLALSPRSAIVGLSYRVADADSYLAVWSKGLPQRRATTEAVLAQRPAVVVRFWGGDARLDRTLKAQGIKVIQIDEAADFAGVSANVRKVAGGLGQAPAGERLVATMQADLRAAKGAGRGQATLYLTSGGLTAGPGTLIDAMIVAAGYRNLAARPGYTPVSLEALAIHPPRAVVLGFFDASAMATNRWSPGRRRLVRDLQGGGSAVVLPAPYLGCPGWFAARGARDLALAARRPGGAAP